MTNPIGLTYTSNELNERIADIMDELVLTRKDVALLARLKTSEAKALSLTTELGEAQAALPIALQDEYRASRELYFAGIQSVSVIDKTPEDSVIGSAYGITVTRLATDFATSRNLMTDFGYNGFEGMPQEAYHYMLEKQPSAIPAKIMALASNDPQAAFNVYFAAKRRGYLSA